MSHVATVDIEVKDLDALGDAAKRLGLELVRDQQTYRCWFNSTDKEARDAYMQAHGLTQQSLLPAGFTNEEIGKCDHVLRIAGDDSSYEIGVVRRRDGKSGFALLKEEFDTSRRGKPLASKVGEACVALRREYAAVVATRQAQRQGFRVVENRRADGSICLIATK